MLQDRSRVPHPLSRDAGRQLDVAERTRGQLAHVFADQHASDGCGIGVGSLPAGVSHRRRSSAPLASQCPAVDDGSGVDAGSTVHAHAEFGLQGVCHRRRLGAKVDGSVLGTGHIVLVRRWKAEDSGQLRRRRSSG